AVISRNASSSAPSASYRRATSTGSPASRRLTKLIPFTTRPPATSRQGMMRLARPMVQSGESWRAVGENSFAPTDRRPRRRSGIERLRAKGVRGAGGRWCVRINSDLRLAALGRLQGRLEVERAVVEGAAGDGSADAFAFVAGQLLDVLETVDPAARDHRD